MGSVDSVGSVPGPVDREQRTRVNEEWGWNGTPPLHVTRVCLCVCACVCVCVAPRPDGDDGSWHPRGNPASLLRTCYSVLRTEYCMYIYNLALQPLFGFPTIYSPPFNPLDFPLYPFF